MERVFYPEIEKLLLEFFPDATDALVYNQRARRGKWAGDHKQTTVWDIDKNLKSETPATAHKSPSSACAARGFCCASTAGSLIHLD